MVTEGACREPFRPAERPGTRASRLDSSHLDHDWQLWPIDSFQQIRLAASSADSEARRTWQTREHADPASRHRKTGNAERRERRTEARDL